MNRWWRSPLLSIGLVLVAAAVGIGYSSDIELSATGEAALGVLGAAFLGAYLHSHGRSHDDEEGKDDERQ